MSAMTRSGAAVQQLAPSIGVKGDESTSELIELLKNNQAQKCVQAVAARLRLPVRIDLSYVPSDFKSSHTFIHGRMPDSQSSRG